MKQVVIGIAVVVVVILGAYLLVRPTNAPQTTPAVEVPTTIPTEVPQSSSSMSPTDIDKVATVEPSVMPTSNEIKVSLASLKFIPSVVRIKSGVSYKLTLDSKGPHTYSIDKLGINFVVGANETKTFDLKVTKKDTYNVYCATPGHTEAGMVGQLIVE